jgi:hypothetical protein
MDQLKDKVAEAAVEVEFIELLSRARHCRFHR